MLERKMREIGDGRVKVGMFLHSFILGNVCELVCCELVLNVVHSSLSFVASVCSVTCLCVGCLC